MDYSKLGEFVEILMKDLVKGEIDEKDFLQSVHEKIDELVKDSE